MDVIEGILDTIKKLTGRIARLEVHKHSYPTLALGVTTELTIAAGVITATKSYHTVDTQADAATDDLDTINGKDVGDILILRAAHADRTVVVKHATGNLLLAGDFSLTHTADTITLIRVDGTYWCQLSSSNNAA